MFNPKPLNNEKFSFPTQCFFLKMNGSWPLHTDNIIIKFLYTSLSWYIIFSVGITIYFQSAFLIYTFGDIMKTTENCCTTFMGTLNFIRLIHLHINQYKFKQIIDDFVQYIWIPKGTSPKIEKQCEMNMIIFRLQSILSMALIMMYCTMPLVELLIYPNELEKPFPYKMIFFYDAQKPIYRYILTYIFTAFAGFAVVTTLFAEDSCFGFFANYVCGQFRILQMDIENLIPFGYNEAVKKYGKKYLKEKLVQVEYNLKLHEIIRRHNILIDFCNSLNSFFSPMLLVNFAVSAILICMVGFQLVTGTMFIGDTLKFILYITSSLSQLFILCWNGDKIIQNSTETAISLYCCNWEGGYYYERNNYNKSITDGHLPINYFPGGVQFNKKLKLMIMRAQEPVKITAMKFSVLSLQSYTTIISSSMSYFTLLRSFLD